MYTFLILWLVAHIQTTDHEMSPEGGEIGCVCMVQCGMTASYIATSHLLLAGTADISIIHTGNIKHVADSKCTVRNAFRIGSSHS
jgi:hypothetical protein